MNKKNKKIKWRLIVIRPLTMFRCEALGRGMLDNLKEETGHRLENQITIVKAGKGPYYISADDAKTHIGTIATQAKTNPNFFGENIMKTLMICKEFVETSQRISDKEIKGLSRKELLKLLEEFISKHTRHVPYMTYPVFIEIYLTKIITQALVEKFGEETAKKYFMILAFPAYRPRMSQAQSDLLKIADNVGSIDKIDKEVLADHVAKYCWLKIDNPGEEVSTIDDYTDELRAIFGKNETPKEQIIKALSEEKTRKQEARKIMNQLQSDENLVRLISILQQYIFLRTYRTEALDQAYYLITPLLIEIGARLGVGVEKVTAMTFKELIDYLKNGTIPDFEKINQRLIKFAHILENGRIKILTGSVVDEIEKQVEENTIRDSEKSSNKLMGQPIFPGLVKGTARIVLNTKDSKKVNKGDILVANMTTPDLMLAIHKAKAIVTDEGGITCHAAIVSREFSIPCVIATHKATKILKDGDLIEVDARQGIVKILKKAK